MPEILHVAFNLIIERRVVVVFVIHSFSLQTAFAYVLMTRYFALVFSKTKHKPARKNRAKFSDEIEGHMQKLAKIQACLSETKNRPKLVKNFMYSCTKLNRMTLR